jgi:hypothetical protein
VPGRPWMVSAAVVQPPAATVCLFARGAGSCETLGNEAAVVCERARVVPHVGQGAFAHGAFAPRVAAE